MRKIDFKTITQYTLLGALVFFAAGIASGLALLVSEGLIGFSVEGITGGLLFGFFIRKYFSMIRTMIAATISLVVGVFTGAFIGLLIYDGFGVPFLIMGFVALSVYRLIMGIKKEFVTFALAGTVIFYLGNLLMDKINVWDGPFYEFVSKTAGENGFKVAIVALGAVFHGIAIGFGTGVYISRHAENGNK